MSLRPAAFILLTLVVLTGIVGLWAGDGFPPVWRVLTSLTVVALAWEFRQSRQVTPEVHLETGTPLHLGRSEAVTLAFHNPAQRALTLQFQPDFADALVTPPRLFTLELPAQATVQLTLPVRAVAVGSFGWPRAAVRMAGVFGLAWWNRRLATDIILRVVPDTLRKRGERYGTTTAEGLRTGHTGSGLELHHLREYRPGDPRQAIDWKASARTGAWVTRVHLRELQLRIVVLLDAGRTSRLAMGGLDQLGHYINLTARLLEYAALHDDQVGLVVAGDKVLHTVPPGNGLPTVHRIRGVLAQLSSSEAETDLVAAALAVRRMASQRCLVILLGNLEQGTTGNPLTAAIRTLVPKHQPVVVGMVAPEVHRLAAAPARHWLDPWHAAAARSWQHQLEGSMDSLRQQGAIALTATPDDLERRVFDTYRSLRLRRRAG